MPDNNISFKTRVKDMLIQYAGIYYTTFVCMDYLILSDAFHKCSYYVLSAEKDNFLHLTGVSTLLSASSFFEKCLDGSLSENDFELTSPGQDKKAAKGTIRRKIKSLSYIGTLISESSLIEEDFRKNNVHCTIASSDGLCTMGFIAVPKARPKTLLLGDELDHNKAMPMKIILKKKHENELYDIVIGGSDDVLASNYDLLKDFIAPNIKDKIQSFLLKAAENPENSEMIASAEESCIPHSYKNA